MPEWLTEYLKQSPTLGACLAIVYFAWKYSQSLHNRYLDTLEKSHAAHLASKDAEITRLREDLEVLRKERDKLQKQLTHPKDKS